MLRFLSNIILALVFGFGCFCIGAVAGSNYAIKNMEPKREYIQVPIPARLYTVSKIEHSMRAGNTDSLIRFYTQYTKNRNISALILHASDVYDIPTNVLMSIIWMESGFRPTAVNGHLNKDGSNDVGLMQLNSKYFGKVDRYDPRSNVRAGCEHLVHLKNKYGSWDAAILFYNGFSKNAVKYQARVLEKEREFDREFVKAKI
jgi:soluble lytic murein transglycosylase-like protein